MDIAAQRRVMIIIVIRFLEQFLLPSSRLVIALSAAIRRTVYTDIEMVAAVINIRNLSYHIDAAACVFMSGTM